jgi:lincosamide and streptogramin A transport system ATP-binding/permease protein
MSAITLSHVDFHYSSPYAEVFTDLNLVLDTSWRTGLVGRNGRGKSTLLKLLAGSLVPAGGSISASETLRYFPSTVANPDAPTLAVARELVAPFDRWSAEMDALLEEGDAASLERYAVLQAKYQETGGYEIDGLIEKEGQALGITEAILRQPFRTLSAGQQTRVQILSLFLHPHGLALIDEPTNHLDLEGRSQLADYLAQQTGFILVSHDRALLDAATDHIVAINRSDIRINQGNWSTWRTQMLLEEQHEERSRHRIENEVRQLGKAAAQRRQGAGKRESEKYGDSHNDTGFIGRRAAKQMKRALQVENRIESQLEQKSELLKNQEKAREITITTQTRKGTVLTLNNVDIAYGDTAILNNVSLTLEAGERIALQGRNGAGKSSLLRAIELGGSAAGVISFRGSTVSVARQQPLWQRGNLRELLRDAGLDETRFRQYLGLLDVRGEIFERPLETFSMGQQKKVELIRSLLTPADLLLWDEPMNYLDVDSREMLEAGIIRGAPSMLFVEHDAAFIDAIATRVIDLNEFRAGP